ncbi:hypothetical protein V5799_008104 [Amblyomma americanum]|uniref:Uncharacterized protein n=1 Tax=Amblyomma americanum TaxID=6943 RepID=A0AAQ4FFS2_AMBAM
MVPGGRVSMKAVRKAVALDGNTVTLQAMPGISASHTNPNNFERMRVSLFFQLLSEKHRSHTDFFREHP